MAIPIQPVPVGFAKGINNVSPLTRLQNGEVVSADNVDIDSSGTVRGRTGRTLICAGKCRSVFGSPLGLLFADGPDLKRLVKTDSIPETLLTGLNPDLPLTYTIVNNEVLFSNGEVVGRIGPTGVMPFGVTVPTVPPTLQIGGAGGVPPGVYRVVATAFDSDGRESGSSDPSEPVELRDANRSLIIFPPPVPEGSAWIGLYLSAGEHYFLVGTTTGTGPVTVSRFNQSELLRRQFFTAPPAGHIIRFFCGRVYMAVDRWVLYSEAAPDYHLFSPDENGFEFDETIRMLEFAQDGMWVSADQTFFLSGTDPTQMSVAKRNEPQAVPGSAVVVSHTDIGLDGVQGPVVVWLAEGEQGMIAGMAGGNTMALTNARFSMPGAASASAAFRIFEGMKQWVGSIRQSSLTSSDKATAQVRTTRTLNEGAGMTDSIIVQLFRDNQEI